MEPNNAECLNLLGGLYYQQRRYSQALEYSKKAIEADYKNPIYRNAAGMSLMKLKRTFEATEHFLSALELKPDYEVACENLAKAYKTIGEREKSEEWYKKTLEINPKSVRALNNLGNVLQSKGKNDEALNLFNNALEINPESAETLFNLGSLYLVKGDEDRGLTFYRKSVEAKPDFHRAYYALGNHYFHRNRYFAARKHFTQAVKYEPNNAEYLGKLGLCCQKLGNFDYAIKYYNASLQINPKNVEVLTNLGISTYQRGNNPKARDIFLKALEIAPDSVPVNFALGTTYTLLNEYENALEYLGKTLELKPNFPEALYEIIRLRMNICDWSRRYEDQQKFIELLQNQVDKNKKSLTIPMLNINYYDMPLELHRDVGINRAQAVKSIVGDIAEMKDFTFKKEKKDNLRIGYISPDFRQHAVGVLIHKMFQYHDRENFEVYLFPLVTPNQKDIYRENMEKGADHTIDLYKVPTDEAAQKIYDNNIDILVDLAGYTTHTRPEILALQPAPIQAQFMGYPNTMGGDFIRYILADKWLIYDDLRQYYTEKIAYLPHAFVTSPMDVSEKQFSKLDFGLNKDDFVFCCFNSHYKIEPEVFDVWANILKRVSNGVLWLSESKEVVEENLIREFSSRGLDESRLHFAKKLDWNEYLARFRCADLFLDTFIYNGGSTVAASLWAGCPVLTLPGKYNSSRMGASIVDSAGLPELICNDRKDYEDRAVYLSENPDKLKAIKEKFKVDCESVSLFNAKQFIGYMEQAYLKMWEIYLNGNRPQNIYVKSK